MMADAGAGESAATRVTCARQGLLAAGRGVGGCACTQAHGAAKSGFVPHADSQYSTPI